MTPELTESQLQRLAGLGILGSERLEIIRLLRIEKLSLQETARRLSKPNAPVHEGQVEERFEDAIHTAEQAFAELFARTEGRAAELRWWAEVLWCIRGPGRSAPTSPPQVLDRYLSRPGEPVYKEGVLRGAVVVPWDLVRGR